jgi:GNAT superfamily N-acetyltransferase
MANPYFIFFSEMDRKTPLFKKCLNTLSLIDHKNWPKKRIIYSLDVLKYDYLIYTDGEKLIGVSVFNPDRQCIPSTCPVGRAGRQEGIVKSFLIFVSPKYRKQGIAKNIWAKLLQWAFKNKFKGAQFGLGNSSAAVAVLKAIKRERKKLELTFADISPNTGKITFREK